MTDIGHYFGGDLQLDATGDLLEVDSVLESNQHILRRLLTNAGDYIFQPGYGAGLPQKVGSTIDQRETQTLITSQMLLEDSVLQNPSPQIQTTPLSNGLEVDIQYIEADSNKAATLNFDVTP